MDKMTVKIAIIEEPDEHLADRLRAEVPGIVVHAGKSEAEILPHCADANVLMGLAQSITPAMVKAAKGLKWIQALTTGVDPLKAMKELDPNIPITSGRGIHGPQMSELAFLYMLNFARDVRTVLNDQTTKNFERRPQRLLWNKTVVIVGVGVISEDLARCCKAFGMKVIGITSRTSVPNFDQLYPRAKLKKAAALADFLIAVTPLTLETKGMIDGAVLDAMPRHGVFINIARGPVVKEDELIDRLQRKVIAGAGLDTFVEEPLPASSPLWSMDNVIITPHIGGKSESYVDQIMPLLAHNVRAFQEGRLQDFKNRVER
jgi:phosphoglycerate dehydrogenase-like enzyme